MDNKKLPGLAISKLGHTELIYLEDTSNETACDMYFCEFSLN